MKRSKKLNIGIYGPWGSGNLGDAAIQEAVIFNLKKKIQHLNIYGVSSDPEDTRIRHSIETFDSATVHITIKPNYPDKIKNSNIFYILIKASNLFIKIIELILNIISEAISLFKIFFILRHFNLLIISGGGQLDEIWGGPWMHPYMIFKWSFMAKLTKTIIVFLSVGVGSLDSKFSRFFIKRALIYADYKSFRDQYSHNFIQDLGIKKNNGICPDLAFSYPNRHIVNDVIRKNPKKLIGISPISYSAWENESQATYENYAQSLLALTEYLLSKNYDILFFPTQESMDLPVIIKFEKLLNSKIINNKIKFLNVTKYFPIDQLLYEISKTDIVIASRLHAVLLSLFLCKPVIAISSQNKVIHLMQDIGLDRYTIIPTQLNLNSLQDQIDQIEKHSGKISKNLNKKIEEFRMSLNNQYDILTSLIVKTF